jgi:phospholipase C
MPQDRIEHVIVLVLENRAFDHYYGFFEPASGQTIENIAGLNPIPFNLLDPSKPPTGTNKKFPATKNAPFAVHDKLGPSHSFEGVCVQLCNDKAGPTASKPAANNGFAKSYRDDLSRRLHNVDAGQIAEVMASFAPEQLPAINQLASEFCLCDHWFCEVPGPTMPNRMFLHAATSEGYVHNDFKRKFTSKTVYELFQEKELDWAIYFHDLNDLFSFGALERTPEHFRRFEDRWASDVASGNLPTYTFLFPRFNNKRATAGQPAKPANSQHAPEDVRFGENLIADVYDALAGNQELFKKSALIITYDEHGGFYDHVIPGPAPSPDGQDSPNPDDTANFTPPSFSFDRLGLRVPAIIVSPWIQKGVVLNRKLQHTSIIKSVTEMFGLAGPLNARDKSAASFADLFTKLTSPRASGNMPSKLDRPSLEEVVQSVAAEEPVDPADEPLDEMLQDWLEGMIVLSQPKTTVEGVETAAPKPQKPVTQGDAAELIDQRLRAMGL